MQFAFLANSSLHCRLISAIGASARYPAAQRLGQNSPHAQSHPLPGDGALRSSGRFRSARAVAIGRRPAKQTYKWVDEKGVVHYGDSVPSEYSQREQRVLNSQGLEVQKRQAEMTPKEAAEYAAQAEGRIAAQAARHVPDLHLPVGEGNRERARRAPRPDQRPDHRGRGVHRQPHDARRWPEAARADLRALQHQAGRAPHARRSRRGNGARHERAAHAELRAGHQAHRAPERGRVSSTPTSSGSRNCALRPPRASTRRTRRSSSQSGRAAAQRVPVWPKPPAPRAEAAKSSTTSSRTCTTGTITICAMRSPGCTVKSAAERFQHDTMSCPW